MSEISRALGAQHSLKWRDKTLTAKPLSIGLLNQYAMWIYDRAKDALRMDKDDLGQEEYVKRLDALREKWDNGGFDITAEPDPGKEQNTFTRVMGSPAGGVQIIALVLGITPDEAFDLLTELPKEASALLATLQKDAFPKVQPVRKNSRRHQIPVA